MQKTDSEPQNRDGGLGFRAVKARGYKGSGFGQQNYQRQDLRLGFELRILAAGFGRQNCRQQGVYAMKPDKTLPKAYQTLKPEVLDLQNKLSPEPSKATDQRLGFRDNLTRVSLSWGAYMRDKGAHRGFNGV